MSGISGYASPVRKHLEAQNLPTNDTNQSTHLANTEIIQESNKNTTEIHPPIVIKSVSDQSNESGTKRNSQYKLNVNLSETSYISALTDETSQSSEPLYSSEDNISYPKVIDEHEEKRKSCIVIRDSTTDTQTNDNKGDNTTKPKVKSTRILNNIDNEMKDDGSEIATQKQSNSLLKINKPKEENTKKNEDFIHKEALQTQSAKSISNETTQLHKVGNNDKKATQPTSATTKQNEIKKTESFTTQFLQDAVKMDENKLKKLAQTPKIDKLDQRNNDTKQDLKTNVNDDVTSKTASNALTASKEVLQRGENCSDTLIISKENEKKPIGISPGKLDIPNDLQNPGEGTHYDVGDNLLEKPDLHMNATVTRKILTTESQIENLIKIKHILEDKLAFANKPDEDDDEFYQDAESGPLFDYGPDDKAGKSASDESEQSNLVNLLTEKTSKTDKVKADKSIERETVVEVVKIIPDTLLHGKPSTAFRLNDTLGPNLNKSLKQPISNEASIARSEDASEVIQIILPDDNQIKAALVGDLLKAEPKDSCEPCPGIRPARTTCLEPPEPEHEESVQEIEEPPPPPEKKPPPFECFEPEGTPEYEGSDSDTAIAPPSRLRMWWWKLKQRVLSVVLGMYNCFNCERICPIFSTARLQSPNTSAAYEASQPAKINNGPIKINSHPNLIHSRDSVLVNTNMLRRLGPEDADQRMIKSEGLEPEKSKSAIIPEKIKSTRFDLNNIKAADSDEVPPMPVKSTVPRKF